MIGMLVCMMANEWDFEFVSEGVPRVVDVVLIVRVWFIGEQTRRGDGGVREGFVGGVIPHLDAVGDDTLYIYYLLMRHPGDEFIRSIR